RRAKIVEALAGALLVAGSDLQASLLVLALEPALVAGAGFLGVVGPVRLRRGEVAARLGDAGEAAQRQQRVGIGGDDARVAGFGGGKVAARLLQLRGFHLLFGAALAAVQRQQRQRGARRGGAAGGVTGGLAPRRRLAEAACQAVELLVAMLGRE